jgi:hypothetical protein
LGVGHGAIKNKNVMKLPNELWAWIYSTGKQPKLRNMDMRFGMWNIESLYGAGSLMKLSKELSKYVRFSGSMEGGGGSDGTEVAPNQQEDTHFSTERGVRILIWYRSFCA